ncbi:efflux transporter periplasmic adaptor subunit [Phyllobacterium phragmitis]|uniref:Efflux transporter periplasmic adaptor subunit n=1 Tax=Phyllobacterium phragmitis TaxID=2670329 RepID=A0A2S9ILF1_9HYPH|nr:efflux RND transporter periplasmic adaptor subunit [Phyllobacterium phragmitis]PRD41357.1 efflux transporter periplasmic adaptor subunit [Phyllobacterium phragmitis]
MIKRLVLAIIFIALVCGGLVGYNLFRDRAIKEYFANMQQPALTVSTVTVDPSKWTPNIEAIGSANASEGVDLTVEVAGIIKKIGFTANQRVKQGDVLVQLDDSIEKADLAAAQADATLNEANYKRAQTLRTQGVGAISNVDTTRAAMESAQAQVAKLQATLDQKRLVAPFSGTIGIPQIDIGQYLTPGNVVATLQNLDTMRVDFTVPEQSLSRLKIGQPVQVGFTDDKFEFKGKITGIDPKIDPATRLVSVRAQVQNPEGKLNPGQFVQVRIELPVEDNIVALPQTTVVTSLYGDYVFVVRPGKPKPENTPAATSSTAANAEADEKPADEKQAEPLFVDQVFVKLGRRSRSLVEVTSGLSDGDVVVTAGQNRLTQGARVVIDNTVNPADTANQQ